MKKTMKLLAVVLLFFVSFLLVSINNSYGIYRNTLNTKVYLSIVNPSGKVEVRWNTHTEEVISPYQIDINTEVGELPTPTPQENYNFLGWYTEENGGTKIDEDTVITGTTTFHAHWMKIICRKATTRHSEVCNADSKAGCRNHYSKNYVIEYGNISTAASPVAGDAYDCDVNNNGEYNSLNERFYYIRTIDDNGEEKGALVYYSGIDENGIMEASGEGVTYQYEAGKAYLPDSTVWTNPVLTTIDEKVSRYINHEDLKKTCGDPVVYDNNAYFANCNYFLENSRYHNGTIARAGIWVEKLNDTFYRIQTQTPEIQVPTTTPSVNAVRPVIEIPISSMEGYKEKVYHKVTFNGNGGTVSISPNSIKVVEGEKIGSSNLPTAEKIDANFEGWYTEASGGTKITGEETITVKTTYYAHWSAMITVEQRIRADNTLGETIAADDPDGNLRFIGANPNNYVSFNNQKWRIIGVFDDRLKIVQDSVGQYSWDTSKNSVHSGYGINQWGPNDNGYTGSDLMKLLNPGYEENEDLKCNTKTVRTNGIVNCGNNTDSNYTTGLVNNSLYWTASSGKCYTYGNYNVEDCDFTTTGLSDTASKNMIDDATWYLGSNIASQNIFYSSLTASLAYNFERGDLNGKQCDTGEYCLDSVNRTTTWQGKVGLLYPSDYLYATSGGNTERSTCLSAHDGYQGTNWSNSYTDCRSNDWLLYTNSFVWAISPYANTSHSRSAFAFGTAGTITENSAMGAGAVRPVVYLKKGVTFTNEGDGSFETPYRLKNLSTVNYEVTFNGAGGQVSINPNTMNVGYGNKIGSSNLPTATKENAEFDGWYTEEFGGTKITGNEYIIGPATYYAHYIEYVQVTFDAGDGTADLDPNPMEVLRGSNIGPTSLPSAEYADHFFEGWYTDPTEGILVTGNEAVLESTTYYAHYKEYFDVTFDAGDGTTDLNLNPMEVLEGTTIGALSLPTAELEGYFFEGWYTDPTEGVLVTGTETITHDTTYYARYLEKYTVTFDAGEGTASFDEKVVGKGSAIGELPTAERSGFTFDAWYTDSSCTTKVTTETIVTGTTTYIARWVSSTYVAMIGNTGYTTLQAAVDDATSTKTIITLMKNTSEKVSITDGRNVYLDLNGKTVSHPSSGAEGQVFTVQGTSASAKSTLELVNGTVTSNKGSGMINVNTNGILIVGNNATLQATGTRQAIYVDKGTAYINDGATITASSTVRAAVHNKTSGSKTYINGGTISSTGAYAVYNEVGEMEIGTKDGTVDTSKPTITGKTYGVIAFTNYKFYDGTIKGKTAAVGNVTAVGNNSPTISIDTDGTKISETETNAEKTFETVGEYKTLYLETASVQYKITLDPRDGILPNNASTIIMVEPGEKVGELPTPGKGIYTFDGWHDEATDLEVDDNTIPTKDTTYYAKWSYTPNPNIVEFDPTPTVQQVYYQNIATWKSSSANFPTWSSENKSPNWALDATENTAMKNNFDSHNCQCTDNQCTSSGTVNCDKPRGYDTGAQGQVNVYLYDISTSTKGDQVSYAKGTNGVIYNLITNQVYYWELVSDSNVHGLIRFTGERRILDAGDVLNARDLGGLPVDIDGDGNIDGHLEYGKLIRGIKLNSSSSVTELNNLGITKELDLREANSDTYKLSNYERIEAQNYYVKHNSSNSQEQEYYAMTRAAVKQAMSDITSSTNPQNVYFHCRIGTDRTGTVAYILEGLLGVPEEDRIEDYELSFFYGLIRIHRYHNEKPGSSIGTGKERFTYMHDFMPTNDKIYEWYMAGTTPEEEDNDIKLIQKFRDAMINYNEPASDVYKITLDEQNPTTHGTRKIYEKYQTGFYLDPTATTKMSTLSNGISIPEKEGYTFRGYYTEANGEGTQYINENGRITSSALTTNFTANGTLYAYYTINSKPLYDAIKNEVDNGYALKYTGSHQDSMDSTKSTEDIYHYYASTAARGNDILDKNNVVFANTCWQMIRTTDTGGVRMIYNGEPEEIEVNGETRLNCGDTRNRYHMGGIQTTYNLNGTAIYAKNYTATTSGSTTTFTLIDDPDDPDDYKSITVDSSNATTQIADIVENYPYVCSTKTATCTNTQLYKVDSQLSGTTANIYTTTFRDSIGKSKYNPSSDAPTYIGYMYGDVYSDRVNGMQISTYLSTIQDKRMWDSIINFNNTYYYSDSYDWNITNANQYTLTAATQIDGNTDYNSLVGKYLMNNTMNSSSIYYVYGMNNSTSGYAIQLTNGNTDISMRFSDSLTNNGNTLDNPTAPIDIKDFYANRASYVGKYTCGNSSTTCNYPRYIYSTDKTNYSYFSGNITLSKSRINLELDDYVTIPLGEWFSNSATTYADYVYTCGNTDTTCTEQNLKYITSVSNMGYESISNYYYGSSIKYEDNKYKLLGIEGLETGNNNTTLSTHHYICPTPGNKECSTAGYIYYSGSGKLSYITLNNSNVESIEDVLEGSFKKNTTDSIIKTKVDGWYELKIKDTIYESTIDDTIYCNDRSYDTTTPNQTFNDSPFNSNGGPTNGARKLYFKTNGTNLSFSCENIEDRFSVSNNKAQLTYKIGLVTLPELVLLGNNNARKSIDIIWTMTPQYFYINNGIYDAYNYSVSNTGTYDTGYSTSYESYVRPVISLVKGTNYSNGDGSMTNPYIVDMSN